MELIARAIYARHWLDLIHSSLHSFIHPFNIFGYCRPQVLLQFTFDFDGLERWGVRFCFIFFVCLLLAKARQRKKVFSLKRKFAIVDFSGHIGHTELAWFPPKKASSRATIDRRVRHRKGSYQKLGHKSDGICMIWADSESVIESFARGRNLRRKVKVSRELAREHFRMRGWWFRD